MAKFCLVSQEHLTETPRGFQEYVREYFEKTVILGRECYYAFRISDGYYFGLFNTSLKGTRGVAPIIIGKREGHFTTDIPNGLTLDEWIEGESQKSAEIRLIDQSDKRWSQEVLDLD